MSDSVDRVFAHALHTVKRIPRTGSARPPPADRLKLYGLYKQSTEGDVEGVMSRPRGNDGEIQSDQEKWDAWDSHRGVSRTEAKRQYITTLIETMHRYASQTADARELVSELEFVWDQIKSNPPSTSSSNSQAYRHNSGTSPTSGRDRPIYPVMSEGGARNPGHARRKSLRAIDPVSQDSSENLDERSEDQQGEGQEEFVDAPDSQLDDQSPERDREPQNRARDLGRQAGAIMAPIANYLKSTKKEKPPEDNNTKWQRRVEGVLIKMNAEMAALREQLEMQHEAMMHSSILGPFSVNRKRQGLFAWLLGLTFSAIKTIVKHMLVDAAIVALVTVWMHYNNVPADRLERLIIRWVDQLRQIAFVRRIERMSAQHEIKIPKAVQKQFPRPITRMSGAEG